MSASPDVTERFVRMGCAVDGVTVASVTGELDFYVTPAVRRRLVEASGPGVSVLIIDLDGVALLSAAGIAMLVDVVRLAADRGTEVRYASDSRVVLKPLAITGDDVRLPMYRSRAAAFAA